MSCFAHASHNACCHACSFLTCAACVWLMCFWLALCHTSFSVFSLSLANGICPCALLISFVHVHISTIPIWLVVLVVAACLQAWFRRYSFSIALHITYEAGLH